MRTPDLIRADEDEQLRPVLRPSVFTDSKRRGFTWRDAVRRGDQDCRGAGLGMVTRQITTSVHSVGLTRASSLLC